MHLKSTDPSTPKPKPRQRLSREESREQTKELLRAAALTEFALRGVAGTSAERIAEAAGFTRGAFYANFTNKESLLLDLMRSKMVNESPHWVRLADESTDVEDALRAMDLRAAQFDPDGLWALISIEIYLCALRDPVLAEEYRSYHEGIRSVCCLFLSRMFERVGKTPTASYEDLAEILLAMSMSLSLPSPMTPDRRPRPHTAEMLLVVLRGFLATGLPLTAAAQEVVTMPR
nr:TetR family transcriptional regulator [uncultured Albidiferax sp.]